MLCLIFGKALSVILIIRPQYGVFLKHEGGGYYEISRRPVAGNWYIPDHADSEKSFYVCIVGMRLKGARKKMRKSILFSTIFAPIC